jgi:DNA-binding transcriptional LysR family regulator
MVAGDTTLGHTLLQEVRTTSSKRYPKVTLESAGDPLLIDIVEAGFDAGVRYEEHLSKDVVAISLRSPQRYVVVASPSLLAVRGVPKRPR